MTRKDFVKLAKRLHDLRPDGTNGYVLEQWERMVASMADMCQESNPRFDRAKFYTACGHHKLQAV